MIQRPRLKTYLTLFPISETTWGLQGGSSELWRLQFEGERAVQALGGVLPFLNGHHEVEEIERRAGEQGIDQQTVRQLLALLEESSFLEEGSRNGLDERALERFRDQLSFFSRFSRVGGAHFQAALCDWRVAVVGDSGLGRALARQLAGAGFGETVTLCDPAGTQPASGSAPLDRRQIWPDGTEAPPRVFLFAQVAHDPALLEAMDAFSKRLGVPWMLVRCLDPHEGWVGPLFIPGETASYASLEARLRGHLPFFDEYRALHSHLQHADGPSAACGSLHPVYELLSGIAVTELIKYATGFAMPQLAGRFMTLNFLTWESEVHEVLRVPHLEHESFSRPQVYPWKDLPYGDKQTRRA